VVVSTVAVQLFDVKSASMRMDVVNAAAAAIHRIVLEPDRVTLVIAYNVAKALDALLPRDSRARTEDDVATLGGCAFSAYGKNYVVLPAMGLFKGVDCSEANVLHTAAHEAYHVLIEQRGERLAALESPTSPQVDGFLAARAASIIEEYRVELAAHEANEPARRPSSPEKLSTELVELEAETLDILSPSRLRMDPANAYAQMLDLLRKLLHRLAHAAATDVASGGADAPESTELWDKRIGSIYAEMCRVVRSVPSARSPAEADDLDQAAAELAPLVRQLHSAYWLELGELPGELGVQCNRLPGE
jgi:hypothetical protein